MDHDGDNDILFTQNGLPGYGILKNDGSENFVPELSDTDTSLVFGDINDDGIDDVISVNQSGLVGINQSQGSEGFNAQLLDIDDEIDSIHLADLDSDGDDDLVYASSNGTIGWVKNNGTDGFSPQGNLINGLSTDVSSIDLIDYDSDGDMDIKFTSGGIAQLQQNYGSEGFSPNENYNSSEDYHFHQADINSDGQKDSMTVSKGGLVQVSKPLLQP